MTAAQDGVAWLAPFWDAIEVDRDDVEVSAALWSKTHRIGTFGDIMERDMELGLMDAVGLTGAQRRKAAAFWVSLRETRRQRLLMEQGEEVSSPSEASESAESIDDTHRRQVSFADDSKGGPGHPGDHSATVQHLSWPHHNEKILAPEGFLGVTEAEKAQCIPQLPIQTVSTQQFCGEVSLPCTPCASGHGGHKNALQVSCAYVVGQHVQVYSRCQGAWVEATVMGILPDGAINVVYGCQRLQKIVQTQDQEHILRPVVHMPHRMSVPTCPTFEPAMSPLASASQAGFSYWDVPLSRHQERLRAQDLASKLKYGK